MLLTQLSNALDRAFDTDIPEKIGVAVSGGGDSMALLDLLRQWGMAELAVVSVNHGLRPEAADELALVADYAAQHGLKHNVLQWTWGGEGNLQNAARDGRHQAISAWVKENELSHVALGHTKDDQAETFLMRLSRGSGVEGLACMAACRESDGVTWLRPLLDVTREDLRAYLRENNLSWADDPSNKDMQFDRVKARQMFETLAPLGLTLDRLAQTAAHMQRQKDIVQWAEEQIGKVFVQDSIGDMVADRAVFESVSDALRSKVFADALCLVSGQKYRPRFRPLQEAMTSDTPTPLHGCLIVPGKNSLRITREWAAVRDEVAASDGLWDGRWRLHYDGETPTEALQIKALGKEGLAKISDWRDTGHIRQSLWATPALWQGDRLIAAPLAGLSAGWTAQLLRT
ncbi:tRNA lysidine(34) synthetase TilS [Shimia sagamensis]|uniref:tRNA(Ile)-lysidine synthase n=1 Tax=Shimia sagamensis TaxID=1566352 RepID=A0ABY1PEA7_9RHOB|nr:tRNA lysidine(34) synthetase TilS [Shimia sagamensis]SMP30783.1 tRNA(Ile)-lysidine synthase [Shimia sagamensis]